jgi:hypothetical protein
MKMNKLPPTLTVSGNSIVIQGTGTANEQIDVTIYLVVNNQDFPPPVYTKSGNLDGGGNGTVTTPALGVGTFHVITKTYPPGQNPIIYNGTVVIP